MSKCSTIAVLPRPVTKIICSIPASRASSTAYWISGRSTTGSISLGIAFVAGRKRVPRPATGKTALRIGFMREGLALNVHQEKGRARGRFPSLLRDDHDDPPVVLTAVDRVVARHRNRFAAPDDLVGGKAHPAGRQRRSNGLRARLRQRQIVGGGARGVSMPLDPRGHDADGRQVARHCRNARFLFGMPRAFVRREKQPFVERQCPSRVSLDKAFGLQRGDLFGRKAAGGGHALARGEHRREGGQEKESDRSGEINGHGRISAGDYRERLVNLSAYIAASAAVSRAVALRPWSGKVATPMLT